MNTVSRMKLRLDHPIWQDGFADDFGKKDFLGWKEQGRASGKKCQW